MMGTLVIDERIFDIRSLALGQGAILAEVHMSVLEARCLPDAFDWSLHGSDGTFVCRGRFRGVSWPPGLTDCDSVNLTLRLEVEGKVAFPSKMPA